LAFIGLTILLGILYLSLSICFSAICKKRVSSLGMGIMIFFWSMIYGTIIFGIYLSTGGSWADLMSGVIPGWIWRSIFLSPSDMYQQSVCLAFDIKKAFGFEITSPGYINLGNLIFAQLLWTIIPLIIAYYFFEKRDV
jgi:ABC-type transport system involved in multi-copper enzyme maturation permease subunit